MDELLGDPQVTDHRGIFEYILGGEKDTKLLNIRVFDKVTIKKVYEKQTKEAKKKAFPTVLSVLLVMTITQKGFTNYLKWMPTM